MVDSQKKSLYKTITWRTLMVVLGLIILYYFTGSFWLAVDITVFSTIVAMIAYYIHERVWSRYE